MDGFRPAFGSVDYDDNFAKFAQVLGDGGGQFQIQKVDNGNNNVDISEKLDFNNDTFTDGFKVTNTNFVNNLTTGFNLSQFGWRGPASGSGIADFGKMISEAHAFQKCMVKRVYRQVCKRDVTVLESDLVDNIADLFRTENYNLKWLFKRVATHQNCLGE